MASLATVALAPRGVTFHRLFYYGSQVMISNGDSPLSTNTATLNDGVSCVILRLVLAESRILCLARRRRNASATISVGATTLVALSRRSLEVVYSALVFWRYTATVPFRTDSR
jgi:hypothetical protein